MALYVSAGRRRRVLIAAGAGGALVGLVIGLLIGRATSTSIGDSVESARRAGRNFAASLRVLPLEYEQVSNESSGDTASAADFVNRALDGEDTALAAAPWLNDASTANLDGLLKVVRAAPGDDLPPDEFDAAVGKAAAEVERLFGIGATASPG